MPPCPTAHLFPKTLIPHLSQQALPVLLVAPIALLRVFENALRVGMTIHLAPARVLAEPGIVLVPQIDRAAQPVQRLGLIAFERKLSGEPIGHVAVRLRSREPLI